MTKGEMTDLMVQALSEGHLFQGSRLLRLVHRLLPLGKAFGTIPQGTAGKAIRKLAEACQSFQ